MSRVPHQHSLILRYCEVSGTPGTCFIFCPTSAIYLPYLSIYLSVSPFGENALSLSLTKRAKDVDRWVSWSLLTQQSNRSDILVLVVVVPITFTHTVQYSDQ